MRQAFEERTKSHRDRPRDEVETELEKTASHDDLSRELDEILDEIDQVLEENAEEFVNGYVQKGGE
jgi:prokaryotic ubiquitin-like protein Pup